MNATGSVTGMSCSPTSASASAWNRNWRTRPRTTCYRAVPIDPSSKTGFARPWRAPAGRAGWPRCSIWIWTASNASLGHLAGDTLIQFAAERLAGCLRESETLSRSGGDRFTLVLGDVGAPEDAVHVAEADSGDTVAAVLGEGQRGVSGRQHRHRALPAGWRGSARLATGGGQRAVRGQAPGRAHPVVQPGNQPGGQPPLGRRDRTSPCLGARRNIGALPAAIRFGHRPRGRIGGAGALGQSEVRTSPAIRSDSDSGRERAHRADRRPRAARRLPPGQVVAGRRLWAHASGRQYFSRAIRAGRSGRNRGGHARRDGPEASHLDLEVTESVIMHDIRETARQLKELKKLGVSVSLDDFGTGYSSLSYLEELPIDNLKIDRKFVQRMNGADNTRTLVQSIVGLAHGMGMRAVAEDVETRRAARTTQSHGMRPGAKLHAGRTRAGAVDSSAVGGAKWGR